MTRLFARAASLLWTHVPAAAAFSLLLSLPPSAVDRWITVMSEDLSLFLSSLIFVLSIPVLALSYLSSVALTHYINETLDSRNASLRRSVAAAIGMVVPVTVTASLYFMLGVVGFCLLVVPAVYILLAGSLVVPVMVLEQRYYVSALRRSQELMKGQKRRVAAPLLFTVLIVLTIPALSIFFASPVVLFGVEWLAAEMLIWYFNIFLLLLYRTLVDKQTTEHPAETTGPDTRAT